MMNRKRTADDASLDEVKEFDDKPGTSSRKLTASRPMQGDGEDGNMDEDSE